MFKKSRISTKMADNEHSSGGESDFECLEEEEIHLEGIIAGYYCIENLYFDRYIWKSMPPRSTILNHSAKKYGQN